MKLKAPLITLEGGEGSGKTTLLHKLSDFLSDRGLPFVTTREPGGSKLGELLRGMVLQRQATMQIGYKAELMLLLAARAQHIEEFILPALQAGKIVLCDRFNDSTIAYQGAARGLGIKYVQKLCRLVCGSLSPQLTLFLDIAPEIGLKRALTTAKAEAACGELDRIEAEQITFHLKIRQAFQWLAAREPLRIHIIDATHSPTEVLQTAICTIEKLIFLPIGK